MRVQAQIDELRDISAGLHHFSMRLYDVHPLSLVEGHAISSYYDGSAPLDLTRLLGLVRVGIERIEDELITMTAGAGQAGRRNSRLAASSAGARPTLVGARDEMQSVGNLINGAASLLIAVRERPNGLRVVAGALLVESGRQMVDLGAVLAQANQRLAAIDEALVTLARDGDG
jgi:hypothetical protein